MVARCLSLPYQKMQIPIDQVLLVDDEPTNNFIHKILLEKSEFAKEIAQVESGSEALEFLRNRVPDLILLDLNMPALSGWDFLDRFERYISNNVKPCIVILSSSLDPKDHEKANLNSDVTAFLTKPLKVENLLEAITKKKRNS